MARVEVLCTTAEPDLAGALGDAADAAAGLARGGATNLEATDSVALYELGFVYLPKAGEKLPDEPRRLAIVLCGRRSAAAWDDPQGVARRSSTSSTSRAWSNRSRRDLHLPACRSRRRKSVPWLHPMRAAELRVNGTRGRGVRRTAPEGRGELRARRPRGAGRGTRPRSDARGGAGAVRVQAVQHVPAGEARRGRCRARNASAEAVLAEIRAAGGELLTDAALFDVYRGAGLPDGTKSLAFALTLSGARPHARREGNREGAREDRRPTSRSVQAQIRGKDLA